MTKKYIIRSIWLFLFLSFFALYFTQAPDYVEKQLQNSTVMTEELIKQFEEDVASGKTIDVNDYIIEENTYNNSISDAGYSISKQLEELITGSLESFFNSVGNVVKE